MNSATYFSAIELFGFYRGIKCPKLGKQQIRNLAGILITRPNNHDLVTRKHSLASHSTPNSVYTYLKLLNRNRYSSQANSMSTSDSKHEAALREKYKPRDIQFKTPFGHIAALEWGKPDAPNKILCNHGWLDNAGSFERLMPFILHHNDNANKYHVVAIDQPGVGLSSHRPPGADYTQFSNVIEMRRILKELKWDKVHLISHSYGAHLSYLYCCLYSDQVESMVAIDMAQPFTWPVHNWGASMANWIEEYFKSEYHYDDDPTTNIRVPVYSKEDTIKRIMSGHYASLTEESAMILLKRGTKKESWGYTFTRDLRQRYPSIEIKPDDDMMLKYMSDAFETNLLVIRGNQSTVRRPEDIIAKYHEIFRKKCPTFRAIWLDGTHHLHMNNPETVAPEIIKFLDELQSNEVSNSINKSNL